MHFSSWKRESWVGLMEFQCFSGDTHHVFGCGHSSKTPLTSCTPLRMMSRIRSIKCRCWNICFLKFISVESNSQRYGGLRHDIYRILRQPFRDNENCLCRCRWARGRTSFQAEPWFLLKPPPKDDSGVTTVRWHSPCFWLRPLFLNTSNLVHTLVDDVEDSNEFVVKMSCTFLAGNGNLQ